MGEPSVNAKAATMKFLLLAFIPAVTGFTPSAGVMRHQSSALVQTNPRTAVAMMAKGSPADDLIGGDVETGGFLDPFNLASKPKADLVKYRTAELKHGRLAMLATLGFIVAELYQIPNDDGLFAAGNPLLAWSSVPPLGAIQILFALAELKNGRLAMVAIAGFISQCAVTGKGVLAS